MDEVRTNEPSGANSWRMALSIVAIACLASDHLSQPRLSSLGRRPVIYAMAVDWQRQTEAPGILCFVLAVLFLACSRLPTVSACLMALGGAVQVLKSLIGRVRPRHSGDTTICYGPQGWRGDGPSVRIDSLPSGPTAVAFTMAWALSRSWPGESWIWYVTAIGVGLSRTLNDVHFPADIVLRALLGTSIACCVWLWDSRLHSNHNVNPGKVPCIGVSDVNSPT